MNIVVFALLGGVLGTALLGGFAGGFWTGAALGGMAAWIANLVKRIEALEQRTRAPQPAEPGHAVAVEQAKPPAPADERGLASAPQPAAAAAAAHGPVFASPSEPSWLAIGWQHFTRWLTTGNVPVKVGVVLSVFGVGFLIKEGIDRNWLVLPLEIRLALVALFGIALLTLGWRLRDRQRVYALSVQGGGIAILYLTAYASFALYDFLPGTLALALLVVITAAVGVLAVLQDARSLAVLGIVGGFMAPVLTSSQSGNHVALFSYYAVLNLAIFGIAWHKAWRELNVLGFLFTFGIASLWGYRAYRPEHFASTEPFLVLFVLLYTLIPVLFASRQAPRLKGFVDGTLLFGTPIAGFGLQSRLLGDSEWGLAISALALAVWYIGLATFLHRRRAPELRVLTEALLALSVAFLTIAVPLALDARWTSAAWALQGAAMVWLGIRQQRKLALAAGVALQLLAGAAYAVQSFGGSVGLPVVNGHFIGALLIAAAGWFSSRSFDRRALEAAGEQRRDGIAALTGLLLFLWASGWWLRAGFVEIDRHVAGAHELAAALSFTAATTVLAMLASKAIDWPRLNWLGLALWPIAVLGAVTGVVDQPHPFGGYGWLAWAAVGAALYTFLRLREQQFVMLQPALHAVAYWLVALLLGWEAGWLVDRIADGIWPFAATLVAVAALVLATLRARGRLAWPLDAHDAAYVRVGCAGVLAVLMPLTLAANLFSDGAAAPLPYVPLLNPLELASAFVFLVALKWWAALGRQTGARAAAWPLAAVGALLGLFFLTMTVARAVHHWAGVPFDLESLAASSALQASLSIAWGATGLTAMIAGARGKHRAVWLGGAALMGVVVVKLFVVELDNTGTLARVISFLGVGLLLLVVGYFAPVPPRAELDERAA